MNNIKVLVVEDDRVTAKNIEKNLKEANYLISDVVDSGEEALKKMKENKPDVVLMDILLDGKIDGIETAKKIKHSYNIPVIYLTVCSDEEKLSRAKKTEPHGYILKPFKDFELHASISIALDKHKIEQKKEQLIQKLQKSIREAEGLKELIPICASCKKIRSDEGVWKHVDQYLADHTKSNPSHSICPDCAKSLYPELI